jgi:hypothetical protein
MKFMKIAVAAVFAFAYGNAFAFHSGGVAECEGCHSMHNSFEGDIMVTGTAYGDGSGPYLLKAADQSGACLNCHGAGTTLSGYHVSTEGVLPFDNATVPAQMTPGGDFSWLKKTMTATVRGTPALIEGDRKGHNIIAADFGYTADKALTVAPGGAYPATSLACSSCHDPHGRTRRLADGSLATTGLPIRNSGSYNSSLDPVAGVYAVGAYRILAGANYEPKSTPGFPFANPVPDASAPSTYNRAETSQASQTFVAYGQGMSEWCANCHTAFLSNGYTSGMAGLRHPAGNDANLADFVATNYNAYVTSGIMTNVDVNAAYSTLTPYEIGSNDYTTAATGLKAKSALAGAVDRSASTANNVACVSCHRVHASGFESMLRFFYLNEFSTIGDNAGVASYDSSTTENKINFGYSAAMQQQAYNGRPASMLGPYARKACNKCHAKD